MLRAIVRGLRKDKEPPLETDEGSARNFGSKTAFVVVDGANCLYEPKASSAVRMIPPYGTEVEVVRDEGRWVLIQFCGLKAWSPKMHLATEKLPRKKAAPVGVKPDSYNGSLQGAPANESKIHVGPRGGQFTYTNTGYRRYF